MHFMDTTDHQEPQTAWDCDPTMIFENMDYDLDLNEEDDTGDWQVMVLDRFGDRMVDATLSGRAETLDDFEGEAEPTTAHLDRMW